MRQLRPNSKWVLSHRRYRDIVELYHVGGIRLANGIEKPPKKSRLYTNPTVLLLCISSFVISLGFGLAVPILPFFLLALEGEITQPPGPGYIVSEEAVAEFAFILGILLSGFMTTRMLLSRYFGGLSDVKGRKPLIIGGLIGYCGVFFLLGLSRSWIDLFLLRLALGACSAAVWPTVQATMIDVVGEARRGEGMGLNVLAMQLGWYGGPSIGALLYDFSRDVLELPVPMVFRVPYFFAALFVLPIPILVYRYLKVSKPKERLPPLLLNNKKKPSDTLSPRPKNISKQMDSKAKRQIKALYILFIANGISMGLAMPLFQLFLMSRVTSDIVTIGLLTSGAGMIGMVMNLPAGRLSDTYGRKKLALWSGIASRGAMAAMPFTSTVSQATLVYIGRSATWSIHQPVIRALQGDITPPLLRGKIFGTLQAFFNFGAAVGPLIGGWLFAEFSLTTFHIGSVSIPGIGIPFWLAGFSGIIGLIFFAKYISEPRPRKTHAPSDD